MMLRRLLNVFRPHRLEAGIREEIEFHRAQSSGSFGNATFIADRMRDASTIAWLETSLQDLRYGLRVTARDDTNETPQRSETSHEENDPRGVMAVPGNSAISC